ncbi:hypothetical protein RW115_11825 [Macrococcus capreoli]
MKKIILFSIIFLLSITLAACGGIKGSYYTYSSDEENNPWKFELVIDNDKVTYNTINKLGTTVKTSKGTLDQGKSEIVFDNNDNVIKFTESENKIILKHSDGEKTTFYKKDSNKQKELEKEFKNKAQKLSDAENNNAKIDEQNNDDSDETTTEENDSMSTNEVAIEDWITSKEKKIIYVVDNKDIENNLPEYFDEVNKARKKNPAADGINIKSAILIMNGKAVELNAYFDDKKYTLTDFLQYSLNEQFDKLLKLQQLDFKELGIENLDITKNPEIIINKKPLLTKFIDKDKVAGIHVDFPMYRVDSSLQNIEEYNLSEIDNEDFTRFTTDFSNVTLAEKYNNLYISTLSSLSDADMIMNPDTYLFISSDNESISLGDKSKADKIVKKEEDVNKESKNAVEDL